MGRRDITHWLITILVVLAYLAALLLGKVYHPWENTLEHSRFRLSAGIMTETEQETETQERETAEDGRDAILTGIRKLLFSDSSNEVLNGISAFVLSPVINMAESVSLALTYADLHSRKMSLSTPDPVVLSLMVIVYFLAFYSFRFGHQWAMARLMERKEMQNITRLERKVVPYCAEGVTSMLFLIASHWLMFGLNALHEKTGIFSFGAAMMNSSSPILTILFFVISMTLMIGLCVLAIALAICVVPYYLLMSLPVLFAAWLPGWVWMPLKIGLCLALEVLVISGLFPRLYRVLNLWNITLFLVRIPLFILRLIRWPFEKLRDLFSPDRT